MRFFNTAGPCDPAYHYMLPATERLDARDIQRLIHQRAYFVIHAPRQTGKTTAMLDLARNLTLSGQFVAVLVSMEVGAPFSDDTETAEQAILDEWRSAIRFQLPPALHPDWGSSGPTGRGLGNFLESWAIASPLPLVAFLDEIDALQGETLLSVLRQLRSGYTRRPNGFPSSVALIGLRDVRDYKIASGSGGRLSSPSPFNIAVRSFTLRNFNAEEVSHLLTQHTVETGQPFTTEAQARVFSLTEGQPWLVNALAKLAVEELAPDPAQPITEPIIETAKETMIKRRQTHLDQLADKLREPRVRQVIEPILAGGTLPALPRDDVDYVIDLGLVRQSAEGGLVITNPIYREVIPRELSSVPQASLPQIRPTWLETNGTLNPDKLLDAFLAFWRQHGQPLLKSAPYTEIAPHLVLMAFLHRVVNSGGRIEREYAIGTGRMDLLMVYGGVQMGMELKVWRDGQPDPVPPGLAQLDGYLDGLSLATGWLVIFDQRSGLPTLSARTTATLATSPAGRRVTVILA